MIYEVCPHSRPLLDDAAPPRCEFEGWFGQPEVSASRLRFRLYPRVGEVESEVTAKASSLARHSKPLSSILTSHYNSRKRSRGVRGRLLLPGLRVSGSRSHHLA